MVQKGRMHRIKNAPPRKWPSPPRALTPEQFRDLSRRREQNLAKQQQLNPSPRSEPNTKEEVEDGEFKIEDCEMVDADVANIELYTNAKGKEKVSDVNEAKELTGLKLENLNAKGKEKVSDVDKVKGLKMKMTDGKVETSNANAIEKVPTADEVKGSKSKKTNGKEVRNTPNAEKEKRKVEVEKKLEALNERKHNLVQMLKLILNAEEEVKRRNAQSAAMRASIPIQAEATVDMGSATRLVPKLSVEVNFSGDPGAESDATACGSAPEQKISRPFKQNTPRSGLATSGAVTASTSGFAPSPAASGGASSSIFRGSRRTTSS